MASLAEIEPPQPGINSHLSGYGSTSSKRCATVEPWFSDHLPSRAPGCLAAIPAPREGSPNRTLPAPQAGALAPNLAPLGSSAGPLRCTAGVPQSPGSSLNTLNVLNGKSFVATRTLICRLRRRGATHTPCHNPLDTATQDGCIERCSAGACLSFPPKLATCPTIFMFCFGFSGHFLFSGSSTR